MMVFSKTDEADDQAGGGGEQMTTTKTRIAVLVLAALMAVGTVLAGSATAPFAHNANAAIVADAKALPATAGGY